ncbi:hypothetical protein M378DRAFT_458597 [Amanita muscaria Koide BX008]|uniref:Uncharacterized protein n=1 Tax=Amanita muscaria (strain Koide BX008) TaxID=946122 RepID=A0A0C2TFT5_AMAMK|nr:hypothetical protein M378DRAFT_458597 [Amanita muscaria Koide BX008]
MRSSTKNIKAHFKQCLDFKARSSPIDICSMEGADMNVRFARDDSPPWILVINKASFLNIDQFNTRQGLLSVMLGSTWYRRPTRSLKSQQTLILVEIITMIIAL